MSEGIRLAALAHLLVGCVVAMFAAVRHPEQLKPPGEYGRHPWIVPYTLMLLVLVVILWPKALKWEKA